MHLIKPILLAIAFATYAFDCFAMSTPDAAMQCCNTMPCSPHSHDHSQECCKTMPSMHSVFVQPHALSLSTIFVTVLPGFNASPSQVLDSRSNVLRAQCHAPPIPQTAAPSPLRI
jgi:hypothetical protein